MFYARQIGGRLCGAYRAASRPVADTRPVTEPAIDYHSDRDGPQRDRPRTHPDDLGGDVARAKRTDRAEARRKYRAYLQAQEEAEGAEAESSAVSAGAAGSKPASGRDQKLQPGPQPGVRMGMFAAARAAYRTPHYRDDLRNVRALVFETNAIWPVLIVCLATGAYSVVRINAGAADSDPILPALFQFVFYPVPLLPPMLAGFLAPQIELAGRRDRRVHLDDDAGRRVRPDQDRGPRLHGLSHRYEPAHADGHPAVPVADFRLHHRGPVRVVQALPQSHLRGQAPADLQVRRTLVAATTGNETLTGSTPVAKVSAAASALWIQPRRMPL